MEVIYNLNEIKRVAKEFLETLNKYTVIAFHGDLGAGKTTFIKAVCQQLAVIDNISSPTFSIINQYTTSDDKIIYHMDLYRIKSNEEAIHAGIEECIYSGNACFIEWPEKISFLPEETLHVFFETVNDTERKMSYQLT